MISFSQVAKFQGKKFLFKGSSFQINPGDRVGLVGPNGAGKTTIFRMINREEKADEGTVVIPEKFVIGYYSQDMAELGDMSVLDAAMRGCTRVLELGRDVERLGEALSDPALTDDSMNTLLEELGAAQEEFEARGGYDLDQRAKEILSGLGYREVDFERDVKEFSGGWRMRIELAKVLLTKPDALVLDEPTNHLDLESIVWLEDFLKRFEGVIFLTSHDRDFMNRLVNRIISIEFGTINSYSGNFDYFVRESEQRLINLEASAKRQDDKLAREQVFIDRFKASASHASAVQSRMKMVAKVERIEVPQETRGVSLRWPECPRSGDVVVNVADAGKTFGDNVVLEGAEFLVRRGDRIALLGINGAGKSTLLKMIAQQLSPDTGKVDQGSNVHAGYFAQHQTDVLDKNMSVFEAIAEVIPMAPRGAVQSICGSLLFNSDDMEKKVGVLSGGEKTRVVLARIIANPVNLLLLDEPTNHLDMRTREIVLEALKRYEGTLIFVSHDRHFLRELATKVIVLDRGSSTEYLGGLSYFLEKNDNKFPGSEHTLRVG
ncbi:MAG: transporter, ATP-binding protein [Cyanobacteria bacterium RYN_339]|nr:transporter, ATP-binding protein [Cyanobacteria bacterium RYN_339]